MTEIIPGFIRATLNPAHVQGMSYSAKGIYLNLSVVVSMEDSVRDAKIVVS